MLSSIFLTAFLIAFVSIFAAITSLNFFAKVDIETYKRITYSNDMDLIIYKVTDSSIIAIKNSYDTPEKAILDKLEKIKNTEIISKKNFINKLKKILQSDELEEYQETIIQYTETRSLYYRTQIIWQLSLFVLSLLFSIGISTKCFGEIDKSLKWYEIA